MPAWSEEETNEVLQFLVDPDPQTRFYALEAVNRQPSGNPTLRERVRESIADATPVIVGLPYIFGEIRWMAAKAYASERRASGVGKPLTIEVTLPINIELLAVAATEAGLDFEQSVLREGARGYLPIFATLRERGLLKTATLEI